MSATDGGAGRGDLFDRIMTLPVLRRFQPLWQRSREGLLYLFFGGLAFFLNLFLFWLLTEPMGLPVLAANVVAWVLCVAFAFWTNRTWVFTRRGADGGVLREAASFTAGRLATLVLEELVLVLGVTLLALPVMPVKFSAQVLVILTNYFISKLFVFK